MRDIIQQQALSAWRSNPKSVLEIATGVGKTKIAIMAIEAVVNKYPEAKILIIVPRELIRDIVFPQDFHKFGKSHLLKNCTIECIQTVYKWEDTSWTLVVVDELHNVLPKLGDTYEYFKFFENNTFNYFLGLSATIDQSLKFFQHKLGPTVFNYSISQAAKDGVVSAFRFVNYAIELTPEEKEELKKVQRNYSYYEHLLGGPYEAFNNAKRYIASGNSEEKQWALIFYNCIKKRKSILDKAENKIVIANAIMNMFPKSNGILFSSDIAQASEVVSNRTDSVIYHSKLKKKEKDLAIKRIQEDNSIKFISTVKALNEGVSINNLEIGIQLSGNSKPKDLIQQTGRVCRYVEGKKPIMVRLYVPDTQDEKWLRKAQKDFEQSSVLWVNSLDSFRKIIN